MRALAQSVRGLPASGRGAAAGQEAEALLDLVEAATCALLERLAVVQADGVAEADVALYPAAWLQGRTRGSRASAGHLLRLARRLHLDPQRPLPGTADALSAGTLTTAQAEAIAAVCATAPVSVVSELDATLAAHPELASDELTRSAKEMVRRLREQEADAVPAAEVERGGQYLRLTSTMEGWVRVEGMLEPDAGALLRAALDPLATPARTVNPDGAVVRDPRAPGERWHDALVELARVAVQGDAVPSQGGGRPHLQLLLDAGQLLGAARCAPRKDGSEAPGAAEPLLRATTLTGHPVASEAAAEAACDPIASFVITWRARGIPPGVAPRVQHPSAEPSSDGAPRSEGSATNPAIDPEVVRAALATLSPALGGVPLAVLAAGRERRLVSRAQRRALDARDRGCVVPGCTVPARRCQAHHLVPWYQGGRTDLDALALVCAAHHRFLHRHGWSLVRDPDGRFRAQPATSQLDRFMSQVA